MEKKKYLLILSTIAVLIVGITERQAIGSGVQALATLFINTNPIIGGSNGNCLYDNSGKVGEQACGGAATSLTVGTTTVASASNGQLLYNNASTLGAISLFTTNPQTGTYQVLQSDFTSCKTITVASGTFNITLVASGSQPLAGQCIWIFNYGSGVVSIVRSGQNINGGTTSLTLNAGSATAPSSAKVVSDGTNYFAALSNPSSGGGPTYPFTVVQEGPAITSGNTNNLTVTFANTTASSGNTIWIMFAGDASQSVTAPSGFTTDLNVAATTYSRFMLVHKATASDTSATFTYSNSTGSAYYIEMSGTRTLDQSSTSTAANQQTTLLPSITPTAGAAVYGFAAFTQAGVQWQWFKSMTTDSNYTQNYFGNPCSSCRNLYVWMGRYTATAVSTTPPPIQFGNTALLYSSGGIAYGSFSIK